MSTAITLIDRQAPTPGLLDEIVRRRHERLTARASAYARSVPIASDIDPESCLRRQVLEIVAWQDKPLPDANRQARFEAGSLFESEALISLRRDGFDVVEEQAPFELLRRGGREPVLRGRIDGKIRWQGEIVPFEVKSMLPHLYDRIHSLEDFDRYWWTRKYPAQLHSYLLGHGHPWGFFYLTNMAGSWRPFRAELDYALAERIWSFAEIIATGVQAYRADGSLPAYTQDVTECANCPFFGRTCNPPIHEMGAAMLSDPELLEDLERWQQTRAAAKQHDELDARIKKLIRISGVDRALAGDFAISVTPRAVRGYEVKARTDQVVKIEHLGASQ